VGVRRVSGLEGGAPASEQSPIASGYAAAWIWSTSIGIAERRLSRRA
jgi:hypothetical protein